VLLKDIIDNFLLFKQTLSDVLSLRGYDFIDCQVRNEHLLRMGAVEVTRDSFLDQLEEALCKSSDLGSWQNFEWEYSDG
jgi:leucyl/phenylalanyl-tRNA--protein transferase